MELGGSLIADVAAAPPPRVGLGTSPARGKTTGREQRVPKLGATGPRRHWTEMRSLILRINKEGRRAFEQSEGLQLGNCLGRGLGKKTHRFIYYPDTGWAVGAEESDFEGWAFPFPGVTLIEDFVTPEEEAEMVQLMDRDPWKLSQSGRRKQDYGPKVNFRKQKLKRAGFRGLPSFSREVVRRMGLYPILEDFRPVEQCNLDYSPERGSAIDPHLDDAWLWGERLVSLNLLSPTVLSMSREAPGSLLLCLAPSGFPEALADSAMAPSRSVPCQEVEVAVPLPRRSLVVLRGGARRQWKHAIHRRHIGARRVGVTFRELSAEFGPGGKQQELGRELLQVALSFQGRPTP